MALFGFEIKTIFEREGGQDHMNVWHAAMDAPNILAATDVMIQFTNDVLVYFGLILKAADVFAKFATIEGFSHSTSKVVIDYNDANGARGGASIFDHDQLSFLLATDSGIEIEPGRKTRSGGKRYGGVSDNDFNGNVPTDNFKTAIENAERFLSAGVFVVGNFVVELGVLSWSLDKLSYIFSPVNGVKFSYPSTQGTRRVYTDPEISTFRQIPMPRASRYITVSREELEDGWANGFVPAPTLVPKKPFQGVRHLSTADRLRSIPEDTTNALML